MALMRTGILLAGLTALFLVCGFFLGGEGGMVIAFVLAIAMNLFAYWNSDKMVLRMYGARQVDAGSAPGLYGIVEQLAHRAALPMPRVYIIDNDQPNAFATGRNPENAAVAATTGLLRRLSQDEIAGVMAHELAHVRNRDTLIIVVRRGILTPYWGLSACKIDPPGFVLLNTPRCLDRRGGGDAGSGNDRTDPSGSSGEGRSDQEDRPGFEGFEEHGAQGGAGR